MSAFSWDGPTEKGRHIALQAVQVRSLSMILYTCTTGEHPLFAAAIGSTFDCRSQTLLWPSHAQQVIHHEHKFTYLFM